MILLYGRSPSGKTEYFHSQYPNQETRILHASSIEELRNCIASVDSYMEDSMPTLVNTWFDLDCKEISDLQEYEIYLEAHYLETQDGIREITSGNIKYFYGLRNEHFIKQRKIFIKKKNATKSNVDWIAILGTRYHYLQSAFPEIIN
jgi:hypothetical protein